MNYGRTKDRSISLAWSCTFSVHSLGLYLHRMHPFKLEVFNVSNTWTQETFQDNFLTFYTSKSRCIYNYIFVSNPNLKIDYQIYIIISNHFYKLKNNYSLYVYQ